MTPAQMTAAERREYFPRGMRQPENGYRFSLDALLLASFARVPSSGQGVDLGCGCGVIGTALVLANPENQVTVTGLDIQPEMVECARKNAEDMELNHRLTYETMDVSEYVGGDNRMEFALANPPYRTKGRGRTSPEASRATARFENAAGLVAFCKAASRILKDKAPLYMVHLPERLPEVVEACKASSLTVKRLAFVHSRNEESARIMLLESRKNGGEGLVVEPPLVLYEGTGDATRMTEAALAFCPYLQCNSR